jgi:hypothetical protein
MTPRASISLAQGTQHGSSGSLVAGVCIPAGTALGSAASTSPHISSMYRIIPSSSSRRVVTTTNENPGEGHHAAARRLSN